MVIDEPFSLRDVTLEDLPVVLRHRRGMFREMGYRDEGQLDAMETVSRPLFEQGLREGTYVGFFAIDPQGLVAAGGGVILLAYQANPRNPRPRRPFVVNMYTEPEHRQRGLARRLMDAMIAWTRHERYDALFLHASDAGRPLYEGLGFVPTNEMRLQL